MVSDLVVQRRRSQILALRRLIEGVKARNLSAVITFIDFRKAFDSVHRGKMLKIMRAYGISEQLIAAIGKLYDNQSKSAITRWRNQTL